MFCKRLICALMAPVALTASPITSADGLVFNIVLNNQTTVGGPFDVSVRLNEYNPSLGVPLFFDFYVGVDPSSTQLVGNLEDGALYSQGTGPNGVVYNNTYTLYVNLQEEIGNTTVYTTGIGNITAEESFFDDGWQLIESNGDGRTLELVHAQPNGTLSGWRLCVADFDSEYGPWSQLQYVTYTGIPQESEDCEDVTVRASMGHGA